MIPVIARELRARMRGWRAMVILTIYLAALSGFALLHYQIVAGQSFRGAVGQAFIGKSVFSGIVTVVLLVVSLVAPALTAGAIASERERQTLDILLTTPLPAWSIVFGKLVAALAFLTVLVAAAAPIAGISFLLGGVAP